MTAMTETLRYWIEQSEHECDKPLPIGSCLACDLLQLERELTTVTEQRDGLRSGIDYASDQLSKITQQRDRLAEALEHSLNATVLNHRNDRWHIDAEHTLQLIKQND
jgi:hypothetical protein